MFSQTNVLITGTKAGIGQGLLHFYANRPNTTVIAAVRDAPDSAITKAMLSSIPNVGSNSKIIPVQYNAANADAAQNIVTYLSATHPEITHLDLVLANAALNNHWGPVSEVSAEQLTSHYTINAIGPVLLYQAMRSLLRAAPSSVQPRFVVVSSAGGSLTLASESPFPVIAYSMSKAAVNYFVRRVNLEEERIVPVAFSPGWVASGKGNEVAGRMGLEEAPISVEECARKMAAVVDQATKESTGGTFQDADGEVVPW